MRGPHARARIAAAPARRYAIQPRRFGINSARCIECDAASQLAVRLGGSVALARPTERRMTAWTTANQWRRRRPCCSPAGAPSNRRRSIGLARRARRPSRRARYWRHLFSAPPRATPRLRLYRRSRQVRSRFHSRATAAPARRRRVLRLSSRARCLHHLFSVLLRGILHFNFCKRSRRVRKRFPSRATASPPQARRCSARRRCPYSAR